MPSKAVYGSSDGIAPALFREKRMGKNGGKPHQPNSVVYQNVSKQICRDAAFDGGILAVLQQQDDGDCRPICPCRTDNRTQYCHQQGKASVTQHNGGDVVTPERDGGVLMPISNRLLCPPLHKPCHTPGVHNVLAAKSIHA